MQAELYGQAVPNGTFENWNTIPYEDANGWNTANSRDLQTLGVATITKVSGYQGGYALRVETKVVGQDTSESYFLNTNNPCSDPDKWTGGVPYAQQPTAITGYCRYNLPGNDTAIMLVIFRKNGVHIGDNLIKFRNSSGSQLTFTSFSFPVTCSGTPDSIIIAAAASNKVSNQGVQNGSFLELDKLAFSGTTQAIPDGDFENWTAKSYDQANYWSSWGNGVSRSTSSFAGTYAVRLESTGDCGNTEIRSSGITTGYMTENNGPDGGRPYTLQSDTLFGYYKYTPQGNDSASVYVNLTKNNASIGGGMMWLQAASGYTFFKMPFGSGSAPDTMRVDFMSSKWNATPGNIGSVLYIDNVYLKSSGLGLFDHGKPALQSNAYPNPVKSLLNIAFSTALHDDVLVRVHDVLGKTVIQEHIANAGALVKLNVAELKPGIYFYEVIGSEGVTTNKFIKE